jgi:hypothetical protein
LPFWRRIVPGLRVVLCVRDVTEVARSLHVRDGLPLVEATHLWLEYNRRLLGAVPRGRTLVTSYDVYFDHPESEIDRIVQRLDLPASTETVASAARTVKASLRHHESRRDAVVVPAEVSRIRQELDALDRD